MPKRKLTPAEVERACQWREAGHSAEWIARRLGCSSGAVNWQCLKHGADSPKARPIDPGVRGPLVVRRGAHQVRRFTPDEDTTILAMERDGETPSAIARTLGRRHNSIIGRLMTLARHDERRARAADLSGPA